MSLIKEELDLIHKLGDCWNDFLKLQVFHDDERIDFKKSIHELQQIVMSRSAVRCHKDFFKNKSKEIEIK